MAYKDPKIYGNEFFAETDVTSTSVAFVAFLDPTLTAYVDGLQVAIRFNLSAAATATLSIDGLAALPIVKDGNVAIANVDIVAGDTLILVYNLANNNFVCTTKFPAGGTPFVLNGNEFYYTTTALVGNDYTAPAISLLNGKRVWVKFHTTNILSGVTLNTVPVNKNGSTALAIGDITTNEIFELVYSTVTAFWQVIGKMPASLPPTGTSGFPLIWNGTAWVADNGTSLYGIASDSGGGVYTTSLTPNLTAYIEGQEYRIKFNTANVGANPTLNINSLGAKNIIRGDGSNLLAGDIVAGETLELIYNYNGKLQVVGKFGSGNFSVNDLAWKTTFDSEINLGPGGIHSITNAEFVFNSYNHRVFIYDATPTTTSGGGWSLDISSPSPINGSEILFVRKGVSAQPTFIYQGTGSIYDLSSHTLISNVQLTNSLTKAHFIYMNDFGAWVRVD